MELERALQQYFGFSAFRPGQREACEAALAGHDTLVVMPTGSGKSLCYQLPALMRDDLTIVVSPLVALMQDQVEALQARGLGDRVALVNAQRDASTNAETLRRAAGGDLSLLYVAPERFASPGFLDAMQNARIGLFVVDEAHCVSQWGHDFRPDYFRLADAARYLGAGSIVASTATATPQVALDIARRLGLDDPVKVATGFDRPNISFVVARPGGHEKRALIAHTLAEPDALPAIVYAGTRAGTEEIAEQLTEALGEPALAYHAGLDRETRADAQRRFLADDVRVIVATNAFGMGVDKSNVRTVIHASTPASLEAYYQEAGRGGRDGQPARALLLAENRDKALHVHFIKREEVDEKLPARLYEQLRAGANENGRYAIDASALVGAVGGMPDRLRAVLGHLTRAGAISPSPSSPDRVAGKIVAPYERLVAAQCRRSVEEGASARWRQYRQIWAYVESDRCRRTAILKHFGDRAIGEPRPAVEGRETSPGGAIPKRSRDSSPVPCCDVCTQELIPKLPPMPKHEVANLDDAIVSIARLAKPAIGRTTCAAIVHGGRSQKIERNSYDGLPGYAVGAHMRRADILARVDELIAAGSIEVSGGIRPTLSVPAAQLAA
ncbi:MAG TPA: ATP-dependent DNA helicase RecQ [Thermoleophilaceae bacterium]|nr:ATP-dependent DNA helicase RecQ [Thermoleophilaceae bacterium]